LGLLHTYISSHEYESSRRNFADDMLSGRVAKFIDCFFADFRLILNFDSEFLTEYWSTRDSTVSSISTGSCDSLVTFVDSLK
jgi:hypothetical protein